MLNKDRLACEIATLVHNKYLMTAYGIKDCNINFTVGDLREKIINKTILDNGYNCNMFPKCHPDKKDIENVAIPLFPTVTNIPPTIIIQRPTVTNITNQTIIQSSGTPGNFVFNQDSSSNVWVIDHNLGFNPNITIVDPNGDEIEGDIKYSINNKQVTVYFSQPVIGTAFLS